MASFVSTETLQAQYAEEQKANPSQATLNAKALANYQEDRAKQIEQSVKTPPPPAAFRGLHVGPELSVEYEDAHATPVEGSNALLRNLSPFMIQVEPPLAYGADGGRIDGKQTPGIDVNTFGAAAGSTVSLAQKARANLAQSGISGIDYTADSPEGYITANSSGGPNKHKTPEGTQADATGSTSGRLGKPAIADLYTAVDISMQLSAILNTPPLVLLVNPSTLVLAVTKLQQFQDRSRSGYIFHAWGEEQPKLTITAKCGAFISGGRGVSFASKRDSAAWQNLMNSFTLYRNNGYIYDTQGRSNAHHFVGMLSVWYDGWVYYGHMESFAYAYQDTQPNGGVEFTMEFTVSAMTDTAPATNIVTPMRSPTPNLFDPGANLRAQNSAGEFALGFDDGGAYLTSQGQRVDPTAALQSLAPVDLVQVGDPDYQSPDIREERPQGVESQETGTSGFQSTSVADEPGVQQTARGRAERFEG